MDKLIGMFEQDRHVLLLVALFCIMLGVCLHLHGDAGPTPDPSLQQLTSWAREATAGILGAILIKIHPGQPAKNE